MENKVCHMTGRWQVTKKTNVLLHNIQKLHLGLKKWMLSSFIGIPFCSTS